MKLKQALIKNTSWNFIGLFFTFVNNILIVRMLGADLSGSFFYNIAGLILLVILLRFGIENGLTYFGAKTPSSIGFLLSLIIPLSVLQWLLSYLILSNYNSGPKFLSPIWMSSFVTANILLYYITGFFHARKQFSAINIIATVLSLVQCAVLGYYFYFNSIDSNPVASSLYSVLFKVLSVTTITQVIVAVIVFLIKNRAIIHGVEYNRKVIIDLWKYSGFNYLNALLVFLATRTDFYFVEKYCAAGELGNYIQAAKIAQLGMIIPGLIGGVVFSFAINSGKTFSHKVASLCRMVTAMFICVFVGVLIFGYFLFPILLGKEFVLVYQIVLVTVVGIACMGISIVLMSYFEGKNFQKIILYANFAMLILIAIGDFLFVKRFGYIAAGIMFTFGNLVGLAIFMYFFIKQSGQNIASMFILKRADLQAVYSYLWKR